MEKLILLFLYLFMAQSLSIFNFTSESSIANWRILDDVVMGGRSNGEFQLNSMGHGEFFGTISLQNNGGFSSLRYDFKTLNTTLYSMFVLRIKGDGKPYQFRVKRAQSDQYSYIYTFQTSGDWQSIEIPFKEMYPSYRGYRLDIPNFAGSQMEEIAFLFGNKKEETFRLLIDSVRLN